MSILRSAIFLILLILILSCAKDKREEVFETDKKLVMVIIDGPRYSETGGDSAGTYTPFFRNFIQPTGICFSNFMNSGETYTIPGHTSITTGVNQTISNSGSEYPANPGLLQLMLKKYPDHRAKVWLIASKDKLEVLTNCSNPQYKDKYSCSVDCGQNGLGTGYREDTLTFRKAKNVINTSHPDMLIVQFKQPDAAGHAYDWNGYLSGIRLTDSLTYELWKLVDQDPYYKGKTYFVITNDHGRHSDGHLDGFVSHGDQCQSCKQINLFISGPGIRSNVTINTPYDQRDLNRTIINCLGLDPSFSKGKLISSLFTP